MKFGLIPTEGGHFYREALEEVVLAEEMGFDSVWMEEHHGIKDHYWPSPFLVLTGFATRTSRIRLGTDVIVLPFYHPTRAAEDAAMLDVISDGRLTLGVAIGYRPDEFAMLGAQLERRGARFEEQLQIMRRLWTEDSVTFEGQFYRLEHARIEPKPVQPGGVPIWLGAWGPLGMKRAAQLAEAWLPGPTAKLDKLLASREKYHAELRTLGKDPAAVPAPLTREVVIAETEAQARELAERHLLINYRDEYGGGTWSHPLIGAEDSTPVDRLEAIARNRFIIGTPDQCITQIQAFRETVGVDHLICRLFFPGMPHQHILQEVRLLATEVFPAFAESKSAAPV
ncbi:MAG TPA: LLM class flavin-dependent oxidoreductase [Chloroflexota bacterium]|nr:LLM class flavin-dependent oxidoreductase [Chloroflexota bacterium]